MPIDPIKFLERYNIPYDDSSKDWINIQCPMCPDSKKHGGFSILYGNYNCFRCGKHYILNVISSLLNVSIDAAARIYHENKVRGIETSFQKPFEKACPTKTCILPRNSVPLLNSHKRYLRKRGFDPDEIIREWGILGTNHIGPFMKRIIIPIFVNGRMVCFTSRDITEQADIRYKTCSIEESEIPIKETLYGIDKCKGKKTIVVEGPMDVWRMGPGTVSTYGTQYTNKQLEILIKRFKTVYVMFDPDEAGQIASEKLYHELTGFGIDSGIITLDGKDPAELSLEEIKEYKKLIE